MQKVKGILPINVNISLIFNLLDLNQDFFYLIILSIDFGDDWRYICWLSYIKSYFLHSMWRASGSYNQRG